MAQPDCIPEDVELRCTGGLHGITKGEAFGKVEVKCRHWACTRQNPTYHLFDLATGKLLETYRYKEPNKENRNG